MLFFSIILLKSETNILHRREARLLEEHTLNLSRRDEVHGAHKDLRESVYQAEMTSLQEQKSLLMERLDQTESEISQCLDTNHSKCCCLF